MRRKRRTTAAAVAAAGLVFAGADVSDGHPTAGGVLGAKVPQPFVSGSGWRAFYTQQHGENQTFELLRTR
jgi:hypothetical protein